MENIRLFFSVLFNEATDRIGFEPERVKAWLADAKRRRLTYAVAMFTLSLFILFVYACSQRPDV